VKVSGRLGRHGRVSLRLDPVEVELLNQLLEDLEGVLEGTPESQSGSDTAVLERLYPSAYRDDDRAEAEFRSLTESSLHSERNERIAACRGELAESSGRGPVGAVIDIADADVARRWLQVLNDLRLAHGTRLGITEDGDGDDFDPGDPAQRPKLVYYWLTAVQDSVVRAVMR
jgi:hypothetical protein